MLAAAEANPDGRIGKDGTERIQDAAGEGGKEAQALEGIKDTIVGIHKGQASPRGLTVMMNDAVAAGVPPEKVAQTAQSMIGENHGGKNQLIIAAVQHFRQQHGVTTQTASTGGHVGSHQG